MKTWKYLNSSTFRLNMPAKDKAVVKCVASILVTTAMSSWLLLLIIIKLWQTSFWQSEDVVIKQQEPPMAPVNIIFTLLLFSPFHHCLHQHQSRKNSVSASAMLTGKFLQIRKVFANPESFCNKLIIGLRISGQFGKCLDTIETSKYCAKCPDEL